MVEALCGIFVHYRSITCYDRVTATMIVIQLFSLLKDIERISGLNKHKLNKYELIPSLFENKFVVFDYLINMKKYNYDIEYKLLDVNIITQRFDVDKKEFGSIKDDILFITIHSL